MNQDLICTIANALKSVKNTRFFTSERGFQGQFHAELENLFRERDLIPNQAIIDEEYQKTIPNHGISHRPDLIIHIPFENGLAWAVVSEA
jgi:hypothetical protein